MRIYQVYVGGEFHSGPKEIRGYFKSFSDAKKYVMRLGNRPNFKIESQTLPDAVAKELLSLSR